MTSTLFDRTFRDSEGKIVIGQMPNLLVWVWFAASLGKLLIPNGNLYTIFDAIAFGSLFAWAWQEIFDGVNYFRRALGLIVLVTAIALRVNA